MTEDKEGRKRKHNTDKECSSNSEEECEEYSDEEGGMRIDDIYIPPPPRNSCSSESNGPRLIITKIVNENFKSYAGVQELGPFHKVRFSGTFDILIIVFNIFSVLMLLLDQMVVEKVTLLILCCLCLDIVQLKYDRKIFRYYYTILNIIEMYSLALYQCILFKL